jgi:hypothetical protein
MSLFTDYDVFVLFDTPDQATGVWNRVFGTPSPTAQLELGELVIHASYNPQAIPSEELDLRRVGPDFELGHAFIGLNLGTIAASPFAPGGRMRVASQMVGAFLNAPGLGVVLSGAARCVKSAAQFLEELGDPNDPECSPYMAWLDTLATPEECRSFGLPRYFGVPNVRAVVPSEDRYGLERAMQAVQFMSGALALGVITHKVSALEVPVWYRNGRRSPSPPKPTESVVVWQTHWDTATATVTLESPDFVSRHPGVLLDSGQADFDSYSRAVADLLLERLGPSDMVEVDAVEYRAQGQPDIRILLFEGYGLYLFATAGFGLRLARSGNASLGTLRAEFCIYTTTDDTRLERVLLDIGNVALTTPVEGGLKDFDCIQAANGWNYFIVPMQDLALGKSGLPLRMVALVTDQEKLEIRSAPDPAAWYQSNLSLGQIAERWTLFLVS